jgi:hypothetical protein
MGDGRQCGGEAIYQVKIQGTLDERTSDWVGGTAISTRQGSDGPPITVLTVAVPDQAALRGVLSRIWDLNLTLIALIRVNADGG